MPVCPSSDTVTRDRQATTVAFEPVRVLFSRNAAGAVARLHWDLLCTVFEKQPTFKNPRLWMNGALAAIAVGTAVSVVRRRI